MSSPAAPKDPEKQRPSFYIIRNKDIFGGTKTEDGRGVQFLYQDNGRMITSARMIGGITDESMLDLLKDVEGFKKLVHSLGVSLETEDPADEAEFIFQMYGKNDLYGGGSNFIQRMKGDGAEHRIYLADHTWTEDDNIPGQIRVVMDKPELSAKLSVRFYLNDGYTAPEAEDEEKIEFYSESYNAMIKNSLLLQGDCARLKRVIEKAKAGEDVTLAYIGGSITQGAGATPIHKESYAMKSCRLFKEKFASGGNVRLIKAGVGGTPSELGMIRFDRDVLRDNTVEPDVIVVEFAVNDYGDETNGVCYESLVRKALNLPNRPAVILLFAVFADDSNLQERLSPVGSHYNLPMVSVKDAVTPQFYKKKEDGKVLSKSQFFYDQYHPTNAGHTIMADCLANLFDLAEHAADVSPEQSTEELIKRGAVIGSTFEQVKLMDKKDTYGKAKITPGGFTATDRDLQYVEMDTELEPVPEFPYNWQYIGSEGGDPCFDMDITCKALLLIFKDTGEPSAAKAHISVDGKFVRTADPFENGWVHCNPLLIIDEPESGEHHVHIEAEDPEHRKQCTILGFGYVE